MSRSTSKECPEATRPVARLSHVTLRYEGGINALDDLSLQIEAGEYVCVLGANGSGKSTLASVLCGLLAPDAGSVELAGQKVLTDGELDLEAYRRARRDLGLVFQNPDDQIVTSVVEDDVAFGPENLGLSPDEITRRVRRELHRVALDDYALADPTKLSGGQQQRVAIAGALAMEPALLVLDEPGALLDVRGRRSIMHVMRRLHEAGKTLVHITHFMDEALQADRVVVLSHGKIALEGTPAEVFARVDQLDPLGLEVPFPLRLGRMLRERGMDAPQTVSEQVLHDFVCDRLRSVAADGSVRSGVGAPLPGGTAPQPGGAAPLLRANAPQLRDNAAQPRDGESADAAPAVLASHVSYGYGNTTRDGAPRLALDDVSFRIAQGSSAAIVGQTGSGKSTLLRIVCALEQPDSGSVAIDGISTANKRERSLIYGHIGYVMQHPERQLFAETVHDDVAYGPRNLGLDADEVERRVADAMQVVGLPASKASASPFELSGGQKRLCAIAGVLAMRPRTLVLDEPTAGLDPRGRNQLRAVLGRIHDSGVTIVQVTHSMEDAARTDQVIVLNQSRVLMSGSPREVFAPAHAELLANSGLGLPHCLAFGESVEKDLRGDGAKGDTILGEPLTTAQLADAIAAATRTSMPSPNGAPAQGETNHGA